MFALLADDARGELHIGGWFFRAGAQESSYYALWQRTPSWTVLGGATGLALWAQGWVVDAAGPQGVTASQGLWLRTP